MLYEDFERLLYANHILYQRYDEKTIEIDLIE